MTRQDSGLSLASYRALTDPVNRSAADGVAPDGGFRRAEHLEADDQEAG